MRHARELPWSGRGGKTDDAAAMPAFDKRIIIGGVVTRPDHALLMSCSPSALRKEIRADPPATSGARRPG